MRAMFDIKFIPLPIAVVWYLFLIQRKMQRSFLQKQRHARHTLSVIMIWFLYLYAKKGNGLTEIACADKEETATMIAVHCWELFFDFLSPVFNFQFAALLHKFHKADATGIPPPSCTLSLFPPRHPEAKRT